MLISDLHELPVLDMKASKFVARVEDWSEDVITSAYSPSVE